MSFVSFFTVYIHTTKKPYFPLQHKIMNTGHNLVVPDKDKYTFILNISFEMAFNKKARQSIP